MKGTRIKSRPLTEIQTTALEFVRAFGRKKTATPVLREVCEATKMRTPGSARQTMEQLVNHGKLEKLPDRGYRVIDEPEIPVVEVTERFDTGEEVVTEQTTIETMRGVLATTFSPKPDFFAVVESEAGTTRMLAVRKNKVPSDGATVMGRFRDRIVFGIVTGKTVKITSPRDGKGQIIDGTARDFHLEGIVIGTIQASPLEDDRR